MARTAIVVKNQKRKKRAARQQAAGVKATHTTKLYNRCGQCGRIGSYMRQFDLCRICFKEHAREGRIMGIRKSSW